MANPVGRPPKYIPEWCIKADEYLETVKKNPKHLAKIESFCIFLDIGKNTAYETAKIHPEFQDALEKIMRYQAEQLIDDSLYGDANATIAKLLLQNNHGMREKTDVTTDGKPLPTPIYGSKSTEKV